MEQQADRGIDREIVEMMHRTHMGVDNDWVNILLHAVRTSLSDGWGGSMESDLIYTHFGLIKENELNNLSGRTAGDICGRFFDISGRRQTSDFEDRIVGIELDDLRKAQVSIGVAGGTDKVAPLLGAIRGQWINVVVTDEQTLHSILALDDAYPPET